VHLSEHVVLVHIPALAAVKDARELARPGVIECKERSQPTLRITLFFCFQGGFAGFDKCEWPPTSDE
jgi:hypothetical protein